MLDKKYPIKKEKWKTIKITDTIVFVIQLESFVLRRVYRYPLKISSSLRGDKNTKTT
jgi:hypothetical protein